MTNRILESAWRYQKPMVEGRTAESFYYAPLRISCREAFSRKRIHEEIYTLRFASAEVTTLRAVPPGRAGASIATVFSPSGWVAQVSLFETWVFRSAIRPTKQKAVEGCTLVRTWSTPEDLWDPREFV
jgi:hypothetical protein